MKNAVSYMCDVTVFESFQRFQFTLTYHEKPIFLCKSTGSVAHSFSPEFAVLISHLKGPG